MDLVNRNGKIYLDKFGEIDISDFKANSISVEYETEKTRSWYNPIGRTIKFNPSLTIGNKYFEFTILYIQNRDEGEFMELLNMFKTLTDNEEEYEYCNIMIEKIIERHNRISLYKKDEEYIKYQDIKRECSDNISEIIQKLRDTYYLEEDMWFNVETCEMKFEIGEKIF